MTWLHLLGIGSSWNTLRTHQDIYDLGIGRHSVDWLIWVIVSILQAYRYYERYLCASFGGAMERKFTEARLNALRMQRDPHFLFNALNTISSHVNVTPS